MVLVVKSYLSAFHARRKGSVAKKPYNPILGKIFQCHWTLPNDTEENTKLVSERPVPWVSKNTVTFVADQVSHPQPFQPFMLSILTRRYNSLLMSGPNQNSLGCQLVFTTQGRAVSHV